MSTNKEHLNPLIDGDIMLYRCGFAADSQAKKEWVPEGASPEQAKTILADMDYLDWALANAKSTVSGIINEEFPLHSWYKIFLTGRGNFRDELATIKEYKGNRDPTHKPKYYREIKEYLLDTWSADLIEGMEADDAIGIAQYGHKDKSTVIVSNDKDLNGIPGYHYNWVKRDFYYVNINQANNFFLCQMLQGDASDNIPGINGVGPKTIEKILAELGEDTVKLRDRVVQYYKQQYGNEWVNSFNEVAQLLWILRETGKPCPFLIVGD